VGVEFTRFVDVEQQALAAHLREWESLTSAPATVAPSPVSESWAGEGTCASPSGFPCTSP
jgi:hypothetical protein